MVAMSTVAPTEGGTMHRLTLRQRQALAAIAEGDVRWRSGGHRRKPGAVTPPHVDHAVVAGLVRARFARVAPGAGTLLPVELTELGGLALSERDDAVRAPEPSGRGD
jgi:hypothetical protein